MKKGFTLIELLVVISIIGILIALSIFGLQGARKGSRDAKRKADLETIKSALEIYKADCNKYPLASEFSLPGSLIGIGCGDNTYLDPAPVDGLTTQKYSYYSLDGITYKVCAALEQTPSVIPDISGCNCTVSCNYAVYNP